MTICSVCGGEKFTSRKVLWPALIAEWRLSQAEVDYIDEQQGCSCDGCGASLRAIALSKAILAALDVDGPLNKIESNARILDINGAHGPSEALARLPNYVRGDYPQVDMEALCFADGAFDLVVHSDTLEHVPNPLRALEECRRVLAPGGSLCFTAPIIVGRLTSSRAGLPPSYHGGSPTTSDDLLVRTEFGADAWTFLFKAGFQEFAMHQVRYPAGIAFRARKEARR